MDDWLEDVLQQFPACRAVLEEYARRLAALPAPAPGETVTRERPWIDRIELLDGVDSESLSKAHGKLIAHGYLTFEVGERDGRLRYQLSHQANAYLRNSGSEEFVEELEAVPGSALRLMAG